MALNLQAQRTARKRLLSRVPEVNDRAAAGTAPRPPHHASQPDAIANESVEVAVVLKERPRCVDLRKLLHRLARELTRVVRHFSLSIAARRSRRETTSRSLCRPSVLVRTKRLMVERVGSFPIQGRAEMLRDGVLDKPILLLILVITRGLTYQDRLIDVIPVTDRSVTGAPACRGRQ